MVLRLTAERILVFMILLLLATVMIIVGISVSHTKDVNEASKMVQHTQEVIISSETVLALATENETASRGFSGTGRQDFLDAINRAKSSAYKEFAHLALLVKDNEEQQPRLDSLKVYLDKRIAFSDSNVMIYKQYGSDATVARIGAGKAYSDKIKQIINEIQRTENILLVQRKALNEKKAAEQNGIYLSVIITILLLIGVFIQKIRIEFREKKKVADKLASVNVSLEKRVEERTTELQISNKKLQDTFLRISDAFIALDNNFCYTYLNKQAQQLIGYSSEQLLGKNVWEVFPGAVGSDTYEAFNKAMKEQRHIRNEDYFAPLDLWQENHIYPSLDGLSVFIRDISDRKNAEKRIFKANRLYFFISQVNQMIVRTKDEKTLFDETCRIAVNMGGFKMAWIGLLDETGTLKPTICSKETNEYLEELKLGIVKNVAKGIGPTSKSLREGSWVICNDIATDELMAHWQADATAHGYMSSMHFPLKKFDSVVGAVAFYAGEKNFFDASEIALLEEAVGDVCFALENFEKELIRHRAEEDMQRANERFEMLALATNDAVWDWNLDTNEVWRNKNFYDLFGYTNEDEVSRTSYWADILHPDDRERVLEGMNEVITSGQEHWMAEYRCMKKDGSIVYAYDRAFVLHDADCKPYRMIGSLMNVTALKLAEEQTLKEKNLSDSIINSLPGIFYMYDTSGRFLRWNKNFEIVSGYTAEEIATMHPLDFFGDDEKELLKERISNVFVSGEDSVQADFVSKSKQRIPFYFTGVAIDFDDKECLVGVGIDFTERVRVQEELRLSSEKLHHLTAHLQFVREEERKRIGREIHDELGQQLTAIKMDIAWLDKNISLDFTLQKEKIKNVLALVNGSNQSVRRILNELRPTILDDYGLKEALDWLGVQFTDNTGVPVEFTAKEAHGHKQVPEQVTICIFRIYQEALTNITRYAGARKVTTILNVKENFVELHIEDDGKGFDTAAIQAKKSFGILGMKERVLSLRGHFDLVTAPEQGTKIDISIPIDFNKN